MSNPLRPSANALADARLIAAAPDLLAALKVIVAELLSLDRDECAMLSVAESAIAKAEGK